MRIIEPSYEILTEISEGGNQGITTHREDRQSVL